MKPVIFIDANQYLGLYGLVAGRKLLDLLEEQKENVFITTQIVDEVLRNKLRLAAEFMSEQLKKFSSSSVPDHLLGLDQKKLDEYRKVFKAAEDTRNAVRERVEEVLDEISRSEDATSKKLAVIFKSASSPSLEEMKRARARREVGNAPGKISDPLGDQISWEQLLTFCRNNGTTSIWLVSADGDFSTKFGRSRLINPLLNKDLMEACGRQPKVYCFDNLVDALAHFGKNAGMKVGELPKEEAKLIMREIDLWNANTHNDAAVTAINAEFRHRQLAAVMSGNTHFSVLPAEQGGGGFIGVGSPFPSAVGSGDGPSEEK